MSDKDLSAKLARYEKHVAFLAHTGMFVVMDGTGARWSKEYKTERGAKAALARMQPKTYA